MATAKAKRIGLGLGADLSRAVAEARKVLEDVLDDEMGRLGLSVGEADVLTTLLVSGRHHPAPSELADWLILTTAGLTGRLNSLDHKGLIERQPHSSDGRRLTVHMTREGKRVAKAVLAAKNATLTRQVVDEIGQQETRRLIQTLDDLIAAARRE